MQKPKHKDFKYFVRTLSIVIGLVMVWRGVWHMLDAIEAKYFGGELFWTGLVGIIIGVVLLYAPDRDLKEIEKL
ncbi:DUF308 domain-containing protein [Candidatus Kaiserbacteria bacterium]|nr:DUF308 domain-containing protein [Candidatus Kaiserbacteria bacterium]